MFEEYELVENNEEKLKIDLGEEGEFLSKEVVVEFNVWKDFFPWEKARISVIIYLIVEDKDEV